VLSNEAIDDIACETGIAFLNMAAIGAAEELALILEGALATGGTSAAGETAGAAVAGGGIIGGLAEAQHLYNNAHQAKSKVQSLWKDTVAATSYFTPKNKGDDRISNLTSKRQKIAASKAPIQPRQIQFGTPQGMPSRDPTVQRVGAGTVGVRAQAASRSVANMQTGNDMEVPVAKVPRLIAKIHPDVFNIRLPYYNYASFANSAIEHGADNALFMIRLNSIYDIFKNTHAQTVYQVGPYPTLGTAALTSANANDPVANANLAVANNPLANTLNIGPQGRGLWQGHFKYYRVLRSDVKLTFINTNCERTLDPILVGLPGAITPIHNMYGIGYELVDEDAQLCDSSISFMQAKGVVRDILGPAEAAFRQQVNATQAEVFCAKPAIGVMQYTYKPENWNNHVEQKGTETRWTAIGANPALDHLMAVRAFHLDQFNAQVWNNKIGMTVIVQVEYEVQFRECLDAFIKTTDQRAAAVPS